MDDNIARQFSKIYEIKVEEIYGSVHAIIEPGSYCLFDNNAPSNGLHWHNCYEICLVTGGSGEFYHGGESFAIEEGSVFIANPGVVHEIRLVRSNGEYYKDNLKLVFFLINVHSNSETIPLQFEEKMLREFLNNHAIVSKSQEHLFSYLHFIEKYTGRNTNSSYGLYQVVKALSMELLFSLVKMKEYSYRKQLPSETMVDNVIRYVGANIQRRVYLGEIAANACTSERNLQLIFKKHMGKSITDYINQRKTTVAAGYLKMNFKVGDVCNLVGIIDSAQFSRLFKKYYGVSPKKFQSQYATNGMVSGATFT